ncbi:phospholipase D family protein [Bacillus cereus group sp. BfR-BA-01425]|uniref:phospholipase D family protein n=1 Tax=Bacillus cereus group sp. BfR-BA-01425 TaxID=2920342 RepID=UPI001F5972D8|nr:phospholipase D family protein [Bacillus cereus group sp. BfR-BA-01425]
MVILQKYTQGLSGEWNHRKEISAMLELEGCNKVTLATAFLNKKGVDLIVKELEAVAEFVTVFVGVRNGVTTLQGILELVKIGVEVYGIDTGSSMKIFHEKTYTVKNEQKAIVLTGSGNLTRGGLVTNIESGTVVECDLKVENDKSFYDACIDQLESLKQNYPSNVYLIEDEFKANLLKVNGILLDEKKSIPRNVKGVSNVTEATFEVPTMKTFVETVKKNETITETKENYEITVPNISSNNWDLLRFEEIWKSKELKERDLNVPSGGSTNVTGSMLLKKGSYDVDQQTYFYEEAFSDLAWVRGSGNKNKFLYAKAHFDFLIDGVYIEGYELEIKHDPRTNTKTYEQKQPMTHLLWGPAKKLVAKSHLLGEIMTLYKNKQEESKYLIRIEEE